MERSDASQHQNQGERARSFTFFLLGSLYLPVMLIWTGIIPFRHRFIVTSIAMTAVVVYAVFRQLKWFDLGFRRDTLKRSLLWNLWTTLVFLLVLSVFSEGGWSGQDAVRLLPAFFFFYVFVLAPAQEFFFRSLLFAEIKTIRPGAFGVTILTSSLSFCYLHVIYGCPALLCMTLCIGIVWGTIYHHYPNFWGVTISHAILGIAVIATGLLP